jgi:hypothetical protein
MPCLRQKLEAFLLSACVLQLGSQSLAAAQEMSPPVVVTVPQDGGLVLDRVRSDRDPPMFGQIGVVFDTAEPNQEVELQLLDVGTRQWTSAGVARSNSDGFVNDRGETRYELQYFVSVNYCTEQFCEPGSRGADDQRRNALYLSYSGWGETNTLEPGHHRALYQNCGRNEQACCRRDTDWCDSGFKCVQENPSLDKDLFDVDGREVCRPAPGEAPPPQMDPPPPSAPECGAPGQSCCGDSRSCDANSICFSDNTCSAPGSWWLTVCQCSDSVEFVNVPLHTCAVEGSSPLGDSCFVYNAAGVTCGGLGSEPDPMFGGACTPGALELR